MCFASRFFKPIIPQFPPFHYAPPADERSELTQFISHPALRDENLKRFYRYREGMLDGCKSD